MGQQRVVDRRRRTAVVLIAFAAVCGLAWIVSTGIVQNSQRQVDLNDLRSVQAAIERSRWALIVGYAAMPGFIVATGVFVVLWFSSRRRSS
jgi:hypothetical protein